MEYLRKAKKQDIDLLFHWVNEDSVRKSAFSTAKITYDEHKKWFENILIRDDVKQYIYMCDDEPIGQVRITIDGEMAEIDYSICVEKRCKGYGKIMLQLLYEQVKKDLPEIKTLIAKVKPDNLASRKVFEGVGYVEQYDVFEKKLSDNNDSLSNSKISNTGGI